LDLTLTYAYNIGREGTTLNRLKTIRSIKKRPINLLVSVKLDNEVIVEKLKNIKKEVDFAGIPSTYTYNCGKISYTGEVEGKVLDINFNEKKIYNQLQNRNFNDIHLITQTVKPWISLSDVKDFFGQPDHDVTSNGERIIGYKSGSEFKILFVFKDSGNDPKLDHYSVLYPSGTKNNMSGDKGREW
jgi:hypothetical protein